MKSINIIIPCLFLTVCCTAPVYAMRQMEIGETELKIRSLYHGGYFGMDGLGWVFNDAKELQNLEFSPEAQRILEEIKTSCRSIIGRIDSLHDKVRDESSRGLGSPDLWLAELKDISNAIEVLNRNFQGNSALLWDEAKIRDDVEVNYKLEFIQKMLPELKAAVMNRIDLAEGRQELEDLNLYEMLESISLMQQNHINIQESIKDLPLVRGNRLSLMTVIRELIVNATKAT